MTLAHDTGRHFKPVRKRTQLSDLHIMPIEQKIALLECHDAPTARAAAYQLRVTAPAYFLHVNEEDHCALVQLELLIQAPDGRFFLTSRGCSMVVLLIRNTFKVK